MEENQNTENENVESENEVESQKETSETENQEVENSDDLIAQKDAKIAELEKKVSELQDQNLRRAADFDNYRKRMIKEKQETSDYVTANLIGDLLESLDNFDRTVDAAQNAKDAKSISDGVKMINKNLVKLLEEKYGLCGYGKAGDLFNPDEYEAIGSVKEKGVKEPVVKEIYLKGYKLKDKVIRFAKVMVCLPEE